MPTAPPAAPPPPPPVVTCSTAALQGPLATRATSDNLVEACRRRKASGAERGGGGFLQGPLPSQRPARHPPRRRCAFQAARVVLQARSVALQVAVADQPPASALCGGVAWTAQRQRAQHMVRSGSDCAEACEVAGGSAGLQLPAAPQQRAMPIVAGPSRLNRPS